MAMCGGHRLRIDALESKKFLRAIMGSGAQSDPSCGRS